MKKRRILEYVVYPPNWKQKLGVYFKHKKLTHALRKARKLGSGSIIVRNCRRFDRQGGYLYYTIDEFVYARR